MGTARRANRSSARCSLRSRALSLSNTAFADSAAAHLEQPLAKCCCFFCGDRRPLVVGRLRYQLADDESGGLFEEGVEPTVALDAHRRVRDGEGLLDGEIPVAVRVRNPGVLALEGTFLREVTLEPLRDNVLADTYRRAGAAQHTGLATEAIGHRITILLLSRVDGRGCVSATDLRLRLKLIQDLLQAFQRSGGWLGASPRRATPKGQQSSISCTAPHPQDPYIDPPSAFGTHRMIKVRSLRPAIWPLTCCYVSSPDRHEPASPAVRSQAICRRGRALTSGIAAPVRPCLWRWLG